MISDPFSFFFTDTKKSIVLYFAGFHLNEYSHVILNGSIYSPILSDATPRFAGVKIKPSVSYSNKLSRSFAKMDEQHVNIS